MRSPLFSTCATAALVLGLSVFAPGCVVLVGEAGRALPEPAQVDALLARSATRAEVLNALGPADELRSPRPMQARRLEPAITRVSEDGRLIDVSQLSYTLEKRVDRRFLLLPVLNLFSWRRLDLGVDRLTLFFDDAGRLARAARTEGGGG